ncbi:MAG: Re/Si-specific NAD(P)(+) transhydrogenase subunit alpha [Acidimicrobiia bacterium]|nr:Re/Si-specific NAD(P)(+) transhydrogenase subunit alpha [Acidimicrobiia bacterium]
MRIGVPSQQTANESRVAVTPDVAKRLIAVGHAVVVETDAGAKAGYVDDEYRQAGASIAEADEVWACEFVATIERPSASRLGPSSALIGLISPFDDPDEMMPLADTGATVFALEAVPRTSRAQTVDALSSQAAVVGYQAALEAAAASDRFFPMLTTAAGTMRPANVVVLGAGVAGLQAIATARRLGAVVSAFDVRAAAAEQVESLGAAFITIDTEAQDAAESGGYAREVAADEQQRIIDGLAPHLTTADAVITTAAIPGRPAPLLIQADTVHAMRPGAVIVDVAASTGGNCELTRPGETVDVDGVRIVGDTDLVSRVANHASQMYARNVMAFIELITDPDTGDLRIDYSDDIVDGACIARGGVIVHPRLQPEEGS